MFGMGFTEILMIAIIAIVFLGPEKLPNFLIDMAKFFKSVKRAINDAKSSLEEEIKISELKEEASQYKKKLTSATQEIEELKALSELKEIKDEVKEIQKGLEDKEIEREVVDFKKTDLDDKDKVNV
ncbi:Sec-independent protein translocase protein TatB [Nitrosophilus alvini]|uniref:Sec-independent protein translocase protein TatB n=1 Tax=Nitrosophilus alvini TaxID=2714855 RepID=UPI00190AB78B|nr:Sec-independent protein translocase protein TatB [Nitrosophilus alvini]